MHSIARSSFIWASNVTHDPNDSTDTLIPVRPSRRYSICVMARTIRPPGGVRSVRTVIPRAAITALASAIVCSRKWKIDAASTASAPPSVMPSARCSSVPTPPLAITGTPTASLTARVSSRS